MSHNQLSRYLAQPVGLDVREEDSEELISLLSLFELDVYASRGRFLEQSAALIDAYPMGDYERGILEAAAASIAVQYGLGVLPVYEEKNAFQKAQERLCARFGFLRRELPKLAKELHWSFAFTVKKGTILGVKARGNCRICLTPKWNGMKPSVEDGELWLNVAGAGRSLAGDIQAALTALDRIAGGQLSLVHDALPKILSVTADLTPLSYARILVPFKIENRRIRLLTAKESDEEGRTVTIGVFGGTLGTIAKKLGTHADFGVAGLFLVDFPIVECSGSSRDSRMPGQKPSISNPVVVALVGPSLHLRIPQGWLESLLAADLELTTEIFLYREEVCIWEDFRQHRCGGALGMISSTLFD